MCLLCKDGFEFNYRDQVFWSSRRALGQNQFLRAMERGRYSSNDYSLNLKPAKKFDLSFDEAYSLFSRTLVLSHLRDPRVSQSPSIWRCLLDDHPVYGFSLLVSGADFQG